MGYSDDRLKLSKNIPPLDCRPTDADVPPGLPLPRLSVIEVDADGIPEIDAKMTFTKLPGDTLDAENWTSSGSAYRLTTVVVAYEL